MVRFSEIQQFPDFLERFPRYFRIICPRFENFGIFSRMVSAHVLTGRQNGLMGNLMENSLLQN